MKKVVGLIVTSIVLIFCSRLALKYGIAYELRNVPREKWAFAMDVTMIREKWKFIEIASMGIAAMSLLAAVAIYVYEKRKIS